ncbi:MAG: hemerythrin domain-containing protein [Parachlamydiaceae bacterium]
MPQTPRLDLYGFIHKAQRYHLYALASKIGQTDFTDSDEIESIEKELRAMITHLEEHSHNEDTFIHPLYREIGDKAAAIDEEHDKLDEELHKLEEILNQKQWHELYPQLNRFISLYLSHQDEEEQMQAKILWKHFDDARLAGVLVAFNAQRTPEAKAHDMEFMLPSMNVKELIGLLRNIKESAPATTFQGVCEIAKAYLEPSRWAKIYSQI